jgi:uncharacterized lipoprotein YmbA
MMKRHTSLVILCVLAAWLAGCASTQPVQFYTLSPAVNPAAARVPPADYSISVGPVSVPAAVDRPQIVVRTGPNQVTLDEFNRWASPLQGEIARVVAGDLGSMLGTPDVTVFPQSAATGAAYRVVIDVLRFDSAPGDAAALDAVWTVRCTKENRSKAGRTAIREPVQGNGYAALAAAHSRALGRMSAEIAEAIRGMKARTK